EQTVADTDLLTVESIITGADMSALLKETRAK
ncbi:MAG: sugar ABC transporter ATP-binding protein, partial [Mesorhizobium sp.]